MSVKEQIDELRKRRDEAIASDIKERNGSYAVIAKRHGVSESTVKLLARIERIYDDGLGNE